MSSTRTLVVLALGVFGASCSPVHIEQRDVTLSRHVARVQAERVSEHDRLEVHSRLEASTAVVEVAWIPACRVRDRETRVVRRDTIRRVDSAVVVVEVVGSGVAGLAILAASQRPHTSDGEGGAMDWSTDKTLLLGGLGVLGAGFAAGVLEAAKARDTSQERTVTNFSPVREEPCAGLDARGRLVTLVAPGITLTGIADDRGFVRIPIDDAIWERFGGVFDADVRFEGVPVGRVRLERPRR